MDFINSISEILKLYGWWGLIIVALIVGACYFLKWLSNRQSEAITKNITSINTELINTITRNQSATEDFQRRLLETNDKILDYFITIEPNNKKRHEEGLIQREDISINIYDKTREILDRYHANRVYVLEFHNNSENLNGLPFFKYDLHYENVAKNTIAVQQRFQNINIETLLPIYEDAKDRGFVIYSEIDYIYNKSTSLYSMLKECGANALVFVTLFNSDNKLIGFLVVEYHEDIPEDLLNIGELKEYAIGIGTLLELTKDPAHE